MPSPKLKLNPEVPLSDMAPPGPCMVTSSLPPGVSPTSTSATVIGLPLAVLNVTGTSSSVVSSSGAVITGASFTAFTVMVNVCSALVSTPPSSVPPSSVIRNVIVAAPLASAVGV